MEIVGSIIGEDFKIIEKEDGTIEVESDIAEAIENLGARVFNPNKTSIYSAAINENILDAYLVLLELRSEFDVVFEEVPEGLIIPAPEIEGVVY